MSGPLWKEIRSSDRGLDVVAAIVGLVVSLALLSLGLFADDILVRGVPAALGLGCLLYLASTRSRTAGRRALTPEAPLGAGLSVSRVAPRLVVVGLAGLVVVTVVTGGRPLPFLLLAGLLGSLLMAQILLTDEARLLPSVILAEVVAYALVVRYAALFTTPGFIGIDNWTHVTSFAAAIQESGSLSAISGIKYVTAPFFHLLTVAAAELLAVPLRTALYLTVGAAVPLSVLLVYAAARYVTGVRWALLATVLFAVADYFVYWGLYVSTNSLGLVFFLVVLFVLVRLLYADVGRRDFLLLTAAAVAVALTHHVSAFVTLVFFGVVSVVVASSRSVEGMSFRNDGRYLAASVGFFFAFTAIQWSVTPWMGDQFLPRVVGFLGRTVAESAGLLDLVEPAAVRGDAGAPTGAAAQLATYVDNLGFLLFLLVATLGSLAMLQRSRSLGPYTFIGAIAVTMVFLLGLPLFGIRFLVPERWYAFAYALMAVVGAIGVDHFVDRVGRREAAAGLAVFVLLFPTTMVMAHPATLDDPTFDQQWPKWAYTESEVAAGETFAGTVPDDARPIYTDSPYFRTLVRINEDPSERTRSDYAPSNRVNMFTLRDGSVDRDQQPVVYRTYQSEGWPTYFGSEGRLVSGQLSREQVCPETRNYVYTTSGVVMCTGP